MLIGIELAGLWPEQAVAWAREGPGDIAIIAERLISPDTRAKINQLLAKGGDMSLLSVACWADELIFSAGSW